MMATSQGSQRCWAINRRYKQFISPEITVTSAAQWYIERSKDSGIKGLAGRKVLHYQLNMIDQTASMQFLRFHKVFLVMT